MLYLISLPRSRGRRFVVPLIAALLLALTLGALNIKPAAGAPASSAPAAVWVAPQSVSGTPSGSCYAAWDDDVASTTNYVSFKKFFAPYMTTTGIYYKVFGYVTKSGTFSQYYPSTPRAHSYGGAWVGLVYDRYVYLGTVRAGASLTVTFQVLKVTRATAYKVWKTRYC